MPSWSDFLLPHPEPRPRTAPSSSSSHPHPHSHPHDHLNSDPKFQRNVHSPYTQGPSNPHVRHHLSAQGYLQPPPRSRYRSPRPLPPSGSCSSSAQSSAHDLRLVVSSPGHSHGHGHGHTQKARPRARADSAVISSASCTSFSCVSASAGARGSWQAVAEVFGAKVREKGKGKEKERHKDKASRKRDRKEKGKEKERTPLPRIGALAFEVEEQGDEREEAGSEVEAETDWENVTLEEATGIGIGGDADGEGRRHDWARGEVGLAISRSLLRSRSGENLDRSRHWSGRGGGGGSEEGTSSGGVGRGRGQETPRGGTQRQEMSHSKGKGIAIGFNERTGAVGHYGFGRGGVGVGVGDGVGVRHAPAAALDKRKTPVISINGVELVDGVVGSLASLDEKSSSATLRSSQPYPQLSTLLSSNVPQHPRLSSSFSSSHPSTSSSPALKAAEVSPADFNNRPRRHHPDRQCAINDDTLQYSAACPSPFPKPAVGYSGAGPQTNGNGSVIQEGEAAVNRYAHGGTHADANGTATSMHERGGKFQRQEPGDRIVDNNVGVGVGDAAVDDGDIDSVIPCDPLPPFDLNHNHHHPRLLQQDEGSEDTPVARSQPLKSPRPSFSSTTPPQSQPPDSPLGSASTLRLFSPGSPHPTLPQISSSAQLSSSLSSSIHNPGLDSDMGILNLGISMVRTPSTSSPDARSHAALTRGTSSMVSITAVSSPTGVAGAAGSTLQEHVDASVSRISVASQTSSKSSKLFKIARKSPRSQSSGSLDAPSSASASHSDVAANSQLRPATTLLPPTLGTPCVGTPLAFDPATYFDSFSSVSVSAALSANPSANVLTGPSSSSSSSTSVLRKPVQMRTGRAWCLRETLEEDADDGLDSDSDDETHEEAEAIQAVDMESPISPSILPSVLAVTMPEVPEAKTQLSRPPSLIRPSILSPKSPSDLSLSAPRQTPPSFAPIVPLSIDKSNAQSNQMGHNETPTPAAAASGVASLLARRFSFRSKSGGNLRGSYSSTGAPRPSSPSPLRNESFERRVAEVVHMLEKASVSGSASATGGHLHSITEPASELIVAAPTSVSASPSAFPSKGDATPVSLSRPSQPSNSSVSGASSSTAPSAWTTQKSDLSRSPSDLASSSASSMDGFFEFGPGMESSSSSISGFPSLGSQSTTPGTSPGPLLASIPGPLGGSLGKRLRRWSNNLGVWEREGQKDQKQQLDVGPGSNTAASASASAIANTGTSPGQFGRLTSGQGGVVGGTEGGSLKSGDGHAESPRIAQERMAEASSWSGNGTGNGVDDEVSHTASASTSSAASSSATAMPSTAPVSLPSASVSAPIARKLVKPRPNLRGASVDDQHHHDLQRIFSVDDVSAAASASSSRLQHKKPKFTLGGHSYASSDTPDSPKASSFSSDFTTDTAANGLARKDTFRPPLIRRDAVVTPEQATRRWTLASAIMDEAISDEGLLKELERIRMVGEWDRRRAKAMEREKGKGKSVDRRTRALSLDVEAQCVQEVERVDDAELTEDEEDEVRLWEIDVGFEIWEGREGMLAREREREMERARSAERQRLDREKADGDEANDAASVSTGSSGHSSSSTSAEHSPNTTPETTPALSPLVMSPGFVASGPSSPEPASLTKSVLPNPNTHTTKMPTSLVKQPAPTWLAAQRALLICRELILTERRYLGLMCLLLDTHPPSPSYAHQSNPHTRMRTSASTSDIPSLQQHYRGIQQRLQYHSSAATTTYASLPPAHSSSGTQQTHVLVGPAPPARMLASTMPLAETTARFLRAMEGAPSVGGVAKAFVDHEMEMEEVYVGWCREVGAWFADGPTAGSDATGISAMTRVPSTPGSTDGHTSHGHNDGRGDIGSSTIRLVSVPPLTTALPGIPPFSGIASGSSSSPASPLKRVASSWRRSMTSIPSLVGGGSSGGGLYGQTVDPLGSERKREKAREPAREKERELPTDMSMAAAADGETSPLSSTAALGASFVFVSGDRVLSSSGGAYANAGSGGLGSRSGSNSHAGTSVGAETLPAKPLRKLGVRDLAILPTQRVMRYVLLYRDLLAHTPAAASSRALVERALAAATRIAENCDRTQGHSAFIAPNTASSPSSASSANFSNITSLKNKTSLSTAGSVLGSGTSSGATASRSGSGTSSRSNSSGSGWRRKGSRTASLTAGPVPVLASMTSVVRTSIAEKNLNIK